MRVLTDAVHGDLLHSLRLLMEDRLGFQLFVPSGLDWYDRGIWNFERQRLGDQVARQFLEPWSDDQPMMGLGYTARLDIAHPPRFTRRVTYEQARAMEWDLVIATLVENEEGLHGFAKDVGAHYGIQMGNQDAANLWPLAEFALSSITLPFKPWKPTVFYHQEFSLEEYRHEWPPSQPDLVMTRVQCFARDDHYARFQRLASMAPELRFRHYGHCGLEDDLYGGNAMTTAEIGDGMRSARIAYHDKRWSDGYGHVGFSWFAVGRPVIGSAGYYADKLMGPLWVEGETSFDMDARSDDELVGLIRRLVADDDYHRTISENAARRFREVVSFDDEAAQIKAMLDGVLSDRLVAA